LVPGLQRQPEGCPIIADDFASGSIGIAESTAVPAAAVNTAHTAVNQWVNN